MAEIRITCTGCTHGLSFRTVSAVNTERDPELKGKLLSGELFLAECPRCGRRNLVRHPVLYHDPAEKVMVWLSDGSSDTEARMQAAAGEDGFEGYTGRIVDTPGQMIEKVKIFDAGLDDIALEMAKFVTRQELGKDVDLLFFSLDGADNEITLTYPEAGQMQMLCIGFNVYEDCAGEDFFDGREERKIPAGKSTTHNIPAYFIYGLADKDRKSVV